MSSQTPMLEEYLIEQQELKELKIKRRALKNQKSLLKEDYECMLEEHKLKLQKLSLEELTHLLQKLKHQEFTFEEYVKQQEKIYDLMLNKVIHQELSYRELLEQKQKIEELMIEELQSNEVTHLGSFYHEDVEREINLHKLIILEIEEQKECEDIELRFDNLVFIKADDDKEKDSEDKPIHELIEKNYGSNLKYTITKPTCEYPPHTRFDYAKLIGTVNAKANTAEFFFDPGKPIRYNKAKVILF